MNGAKASFGCFTYTTCWDLKKEIMRKFSLSPEYIGRYHIYECIQTKHLRCIIT